LWISRGGFWAVSIAFRHQDLFSAVGGHSPFLMMACPAPMTRCIGTDHSANHSTADLSDVTRRVAEANVTAVSNICV
jgi:S-formylglutathione hydrolase FrmB